MKKTLTANISGTVFHIEEDAYDTLQRYLGNIRAQFSGTDGRDEIMADIEARIAELLNERLDGRRQVVSIADVEHVMGVMGQPEDFADGADSNAGGTNTANGTFSAAGRTHRRLFRDPDDKWVGGVLGGVAAYFGIEVLWLRIAALILIFPLSVGTLIPVYFILWAVIPSANTAAEKLQMRGEPVTVENIKRTFEEGAERFKQGGERVMNEARDLGQNWQQEARSRKSRVGEVLTKLVGVAIIIGAFSLMMGLITGLIGGTFGLYHATWSSEDIGLLDIASVFFTSEQHAVWFGIGLFLLLFIPVVGLFLAGFRLLMDTRTPKWLGWTLTALWFAAWIPTILAGVQVGRDFHRENSVRDEVTITQPLGEVLYLDSMEPTEGDGAWSVQYDNGNVDVDLDGLHIEKGRLLGAWAQLDVEQSPDTLFHLYVVREAHGASAKSALARAEAIEYRFKQEGDVLFVSPVIAFDASDKFRAQDVQFTLEVPVGKKVFFRAGSESVIYDIKNVTNTLDSKMIGRTWTMTPGGLEDPTLPQAKTDEEDWNSELEAEPTQHKKMAASVWRGPVRRTDARPARASTVTEQAEASVQLPSILELISVLRTS